jgi:hypothetical protein
VNVSPSDHANTAGSQPDECLRPHATDVYRHSRQTGFLLPGPKNRACRIPAGGKGSHRGARLGVASVRRDYMFAMCDALKTFPNSLHSIRAWLSIIVGVPCTLWLVIAFTGAFLTLLYDRTRASPLLVLNADGLLIAAHLKESFLGQMSWQLRSAWADAVSK